MKIKLKKKIWPTFKNLSFNVKENVFENMIQGNKNKGKLILFAWKKFSFAPAYLQLDKVFGFYCTTNFHANKLERTEMKFFYPMWENLSNMLFLANVLLFNNIVSVVDYLQYGWQFSYVCGFYCVVLSRLKRFAFHNMKTIFQS